MTTVWREVPPVVLAIAQELIVKYHPELLEARIGFLFRETALHTNGRRVLGQAKKVDEKTQAAGLDFDFIIWLSEADWIEMLPNQRKALIDHELCHCQWVDGEAKMRPHDFEEFGCVVERWGLWNSHMWQFKPALEKALQLELVEGLRRQGAVLSVNVQGNLAELDS